MLQFVIHSVVKTFWNLVLVPFVVAWTLGCRVITTTGSKLILYYLQDPRSVSSKLLLEHGWNPDFVVSRMDLKDQQSTCISGLTLPFQFLPVLKRERQRISIACVILGNKKEIFLSSLCCWRDWLILHAWLRPWWTGTGECTSGLGFTNPDHHIIVIIQKRRKWKRRRRNQTTIFIVETTIPHRCYIINQPPRNRYRCRDGKRNARTIGSHPRTAAATTIHKRVHVTFFGISCCCACTTRQDDDNNSCDSYYNYSIWGRWPWWYICIPNTSHEKASTSRKHGPATSATATTVDAAYRIAATTTRGQCPSTIVVILFKGCRAAQTVPFPCRWHCWECSAYIGLVPSQQRQRNAFDIRQHHSFQSALCSQYRELVSCQCRHTAINSFIIVNAASYGHGSQFNSCVFWESI